MPVKFDEFAIQDPAVVEALREISAELDRIRNESIVASFSATFVNGEIHEFSLPTKAGICLLAFSGSSNPTGSDLFQAMFSYDVNSTIEWQPASTGISLGDTSNPDIDGDLNIWVSDTGKISIKSRVNGTFKIGLYHFGFETP